MSTDDRDAASLGDFLCFSVYSANLAFNRVYKPLLDELGLTYPQFIALVALWGQDDMTVSGLGQKLYLDSSTLTPLLKRLEAMGYVSRQRDRADERQVRIALTEAGRQLRERGFACRARLIEATGCTAEDLATLKKGVKILRDNLMMVSGGKHQGANPDEA
jgi:DNA-binding MarR family transcriptional regulator